MIVVTEAMVDANDVVRLRRVINQLARQFNTSATDEGLTPTQASVLGVVSVRGPISLAELQRIEHLNPTMLSRMISKLDDAGLITRTPDPDDLRSATVSATDAGRQLSRRIGEQRAALVERCAARLPADQHATLVAALDSLEQLADELKSP